MVRAGACVAAIMACLSTAAHAQSDRQLEDWCENKFPRLEYRTDDGQMVEREPTTAEQKERAATRIGSCNAVIDNRRLSPQQLAYFLGHRGFAFLNDWKTDDAERDYERAIKADPQHSGGWQGRCAIQRNKENYDAALRACDRAITLAPQWSGARVERGWVYSAMKDDDRALADFQKAIALGTDNISAYLGSGGIYLKRGNFDKALEMYNEAVRLKPGSWRGWLDRCQAHIQSGNISGAETDCREVRRIDPDFTLLRETAHIAFGQNDWAGAADAYDKAVQDVEKTIAWLKASKPGNESLTAEAKEAFEWPEAMFGRGLSRILSGDRAKGEADIAAARAFKPDIDKQAAKFGLFLNPIRDGQIFSEGGSNYFRGDEKQWVYFNFAKGMFDALVETARTDGYVELYAKETKTRIRLFRAHSEWSRGREGWTKGMESGKGVWRMMGPALNARFKEMHEAASRSAR